MRCGNISDVPYIKDIILTCCYPPQVEDIKGILNETDSEPEDDYPSPTTNHSDSSHQSFLFGYSSSNVNMVELHPTSDRLPKYWETFKENVDPLIKVLHIPTIEPTILQAKDRLGRIHRGLEALLFSIYYGVATSMSPEECLAELGEEKKHLLARYRFGIEQALARADFLQTDELVVLQAVSQVNPQAP